jgi:protein-tyrosine phosphatase
VFSARLFVRPTVVQYRIATDARSPNPHIRHQAHLSLFMCTYKNIHALGLVSSSLTLGSDHMALYLYTQDKSRDTGSWDAGAVDGFPWLYVGSLSAAESHEQLQANNVTRLLTVARKLPVVAVPDGIEHFRVEIDDHPRANFLDVVADCRDFIDAAAADAKRSGDDEENSPRPSILVHCASGVSRSVTAILAWLMAPEQSFSLDGALAVVRMNRPHAHINLGFACQMQVLEKHSGCLEKALAEWNANHGTDAVERAASRRQFFNEIHAAADELEVRFLPPPFLCNVPLLAAASSHLLNADALLQVKIQIFRSLRCNGGDGNDSQQTAQSSLLRELSKLSDRLDSSQGDSDGLPEDRVARVIFKSARSKVERLIATIDNVSE